MLEKSSLEEKKAISIENVTCLDVQILDVLHPTQKLANRLNM